MRILTGLAALWAAGIGSALALCDVVSVPVRAAGAVVAAAAFLVAIRELRKQ